MDAFDSDAIIYAASRNHRFHRALRRSLVGEEQGVGSVLLVPEVTSKPIRDGNDDEVVELSMLLARLRLLPCDAATADAAAALGAAYGLKAADAVHLATAVLVGADRFITNNRRDFP